MSIDEIPLPAGCTGRLRLCGLADVADDPDATLAWAGASTVVCLNQADELERRFPSYLDWLRRNRGRSALWYPVRNFSAPSASSILPFLRMVEARRDGGVVMHCAAGQGRAGTMAVGLLMVCGASEDGALRAVATHRLFAGPGSPSQWAMVADLADLLAQP